MKREFLKKRPPDQRLKKVFKRFGYTTSHGRRVALVMKLDEEPGKITY
ncbi:hypothetical protein [Alkaliphilus peptidifermentans]|uniref:Uncharacterized protein n=1 Tax=Alkaliphilus peptidifermentans DSM 18978 TaxID=1120976 RepID=A0A1G5GWN0_9FIRM|nr:hypothetical protein [Alkaliphilus peptidifermentans]SCY56012.1 hypothetical protein SAMN03080606_01812 [Alkaliphilus peptidifermentans DSM 18978]